jgi:hypothetical protein
MRQFGPRRAVRKHARTDRNTHLGEAVVRAGEGGGGGDVEGDGEQRGGGGEGGAGRSEVEQPPPQRSPPRRRARGPHLAPQGHLIRLAKPRAERIPSRLVSANGDGSSTRSAQRLIRRRPSAASVRAMIRLRLDGGRERRRAFLSATARLRAERSTTR